LKAQTALITGGASLIGRGVARKLMAEGWNVVLTDIDRKGLDEAVADLGGGNQVASEILDITDLDAIRKCIDGIVRTYGSFDAMVTCAGNLRSIGLAPKPFLDFTPDEWRRTVEVNLIGLMNCVHAALPVMKKAGKGGIVNIADQLTGTKNRTIYSAAKAGNNRFFQAIASEAAAYGVRVNSVLPGPTEARWREPDAKQKSRSPLGRETKAGDVGEAVAFLLSDDAAQITGSILDASGGIALH
jgi:NAD(P)-dependent dehydrogenase (short-subunit alcohol dehydrogenase family)